jgi:hypothetical protein
MTKPQNMKFKNFFAAMNCIASAAMLSACGGGTPKIDVASISILNQTPLSFARYEMQQQGGDLIQNENWSCLPGALCSIQTSYLSSEPVKLRFYDKQDKMITAYELPELSKENIFISTSNAMLGTQIFEDFKVKFDYSIPDLMVRLENLFLEIESNDGTPDFFEELGNYYTKQVNHGGLSESAFLEKLHLSLSNHEVLPSLAASLMPAITLPAFSASPSSTIALLSNNEGFQCTKGGELAVDVIGDVVEEIPVVGKIFSTLFKGLVNSGCETAEDALSGKLDNITGQLNAMTSQLNLLTSKMDSLGIRIDKLGDMLNDTIIQARINDFNKNFTELKRAVDTYNGVISTNKSLSGFISALGGLNQETLRIYPRVGDLLNSNNVLRERDTYESMMSKDNFNSLAAALAKKCADPNSITGDVIQIRQYCLYVVATMTSKAMLIQSSAAAMLVDKMGFLGKALRDAPDDNYRNWLRGNFFTIPDIEKVEERRAEIGQIFQNGIANLGNAMTPRGQLIVPAPLQGFTHPQFLIKLKNSGCKFFENRSDQAAVLEWNSKDNTVLVQCKDQGVNVWSKIRMDWFDGISNSKPITMGVPAPFQISNNEFDQFLNLSSFESALDEFRPNSKDFYANPQKFLLQGTSQLNLKNSTIPGYYQTDWSYITDNSIKKIQARYTIKTNNGFNLSHLFNIGFELSKNQTGGFQVKAKMICDPYNPNCRNSKLGIKITDEVKTYDISIIKNKLSQFEIISN